MLPRTRLYIVLGVVAALIVIVRVQQLVVNEPAKKHDVSTAQLAEQLNNNPPPLKPLTPAEKRKADAERKKAEAEQAKEDEAARVLMAKTMENGLLGSGYNVDVTAYGPQHKYLKLRWIFVSKVLAYQFSQDQGELWQSMKTAGFTKFSITDGYDESWYWDLTK